MKKPFALVLAAALFLTGCGQPAVSIDELNGTISELESTVQQLNSDLDEQETLMQAQEARIDSLTVQVVEYQAEIAELNGLLEEAAPWFELQEEERQQEIAEMEARREAEAEAQRLAEEAEQAAKEAEEKLGYNTGITYDQLARNPDDYKGQKVKFYGQVIQVVEGSYTNTIRLAVNGNYNYVLYCTYSKSIVDSRILENDYITIYGTANGLETYETVMGNVLTIPKVSIDKIDQ